MIILIAASRLCICSDFWKVIEFSYNQQVKLRSVMLSAFQKMDYELHLRKNSNDVITTINYLIPNFVVLLMLGLQHVGELVLAVLLGALLIWINPVAFLCILGLLLVLLYFYARFFRSWMVELGKKQIAMPNSSSASLRICTGVKRRKTASQKQFFSRPACR